MKNLKVRLIKSRDTLAIKFLVNIYELEPNSNFMCENGFCNNEKEIFSAEFNDFQEAEINYQNTIAVLQDLKAQKTEIIKEEII